ncbi:MAG TPA: DNA-directed RNA polymerase subunit beta' [Oscillospiraceae bacterium]|nr:DNA-directed RNA polymerase subunit beta' [Oscillospiraceae bacterium]
MSYNTFDAIKIGIASPEMILSWSYGEVKKPETINYRTLKPERDGLFCERIFGPTKDWECHCGKYKKIRYKGKICDRCGVEVTKAKVRRERMGHIELAAPVSHIWYFKGIPSRMGLILDLTPRVLEKVLYFANYIVTDPGTTPLEKCQMLTEKEYRDLKEKYEDDFEAGMGAEAIKKLLQQIDCVKLAVQLKEELDNSSGQKKAKILKRLEVVEAFRQSGNKPEWMVIDILPVIPPELRPMVQLDGGRFATSDLNDLYRRVINRNNRLKRLIQLNAPDIIVRNEKRMLQEAVDALIDNGRRGRAVTGANSRALKSLSDMLKGKQGRFRQNLLGKRVDYSGRSVIVVGPDLKIYQCGVPKEMAIELFRPFVMKKLVQDGVANNIKSAKKMVDKQRTEVWDALEYVIKEHPVLLNRAPTLHRLGIQAFEPILVEGRALRLHPLVCTAYNADFDGDQMAIHLPLSAEAQAEARILMLSANNLLRPQDGHPVTVPTQDMILGSYYLTMLRIGKAEKGAENVLVADAGETGLPAGEVVDADEFVAANKAAAADGKKQAAYRPLICYRDANEAVMAYNEGYVGLHAPIRLRVSKIIDGVEKKAVITTTVGRIIYNEPIPQDLGYVDRTDPGHMFDHEIGFQVGKKQLGDIIDRCIKKYGFTISAEVLDNIKAMGYKYSTKSALTISIFDMTVPEAKKSLIAEAEQQVVSIEKQYKRGFITDDERYRLVVGQWEQTTKDVTNALQDCLDEYNPIYMMANSGARGSMAQIRQLAGMRGLMANTSGKTIEIPIKANYREGLTVLEYFVSSRGARKGLADTALRTADSGYLTRRMVDVSQDVIIREEDCGTTEGVWASTVYDRGQVVQPFGVSIHGRYPAKPITDPKTGEVIFDTDHMLLESDAAVLEARDIHRAYVRSVLSCAAKSGVCAKCYGINLALGKPVNAGEAVGVIAAQSIGEPGTQLTMRTFHTGGVAGDDITQGLPRVEELFEARRPKKMATLSDTSGTVTVEEAKKGAMHTITVTNEKDGETFVYAVPHGAGILMHTGDHADKGQELTAGALNPHDVLRIRGINDDEFGRPGVRTYITQEVQKVYRQQGVDLNDKHIEVIVRQMMRKVRVEEQGSTKLISGSTVDIGDLKAANREVAERTKAGEEGLMPATYTQLLMGITKASLATDSFLSAASFQETTKVLTDAAIKGKVDHLVGLKENVIIGKLIPAGSGLDMYRHFQSRMDEEKASAPESYVDLSALVTKTNAL